MQIHELTEAGVIQKLKAGAQQAVQAVKDLPAVQTVSQGQATSPQAYAQAQQQRYAKQAAAAAQKLQAQGYKTQPPASATPGQQEVTAAIGGVAAKYFKNGQTWTNELGQRITDPKSIAYLDSLLPNVSAQPAGVTQAAGAVMTAPDVDQAIRQLGLTQQQLKAFQAQAQQNPGFVRAFLKRLGLAR